MADNTKLLKAMIASGPIKPDKLDDVMPAMLFATLEGKLTRAEYFTFLTDNVQNMTISQTLKNNLAIEAYHYDDQNNVKNKETEKNGALKEYFSSSDSIRKDHSVHDIKTTLDELAADGKVKNMQPFLREFYTAIQNMAETSNPGIEFRRDAGQRLVNMGAEYGVPMDKFDYKKFGLTEQDFKREQCFGSMQKDWAAGKDMDKFDYQKYGVSEKDFRKEEGYIILRDAFDYGDFAVDFSLNKYGFSSAEFKKHEGFIELKKALDENKPLSEIDHKKYGISDKELEEFKDWPSSKKPSDRKKPELLESEKEKPHYYPSTLPKEDYQAESPDDLAVVNPASIARKGGGQMHI